MSFSLQASHNNQVIGTVSAMRSYIIGLASAGFIMAFFGAMWWGMGVGGIQGVFPGETVAFIAILALMSIVLIVGGILLMRAASDLPQDTSPEEKIRQRTFGKRIGITFGLVFGFETIIIAIGSILLAVFHHSEFLLPFMAVVVGAHFFPLAQLFRMNLYHLTGALLILVSIGVVLIVPVNAMIGNLHAWDVFAGSLCACILWLTGCHALLRGRKLLEQTQS